MCSEYLVCLQGEAGPMCPRSKNIYHSVCCHWHNNVNVIDQKSRHRRKSRVSVYKTESEIETSAEVKEGCEEILGVEEEESKGVKRELVGVKEELNEELVEGKESFKDGSKIVNVPRRLGTKRRGRTVTQVLVVIVCS